MRALETKNVSERPAVRSLKVEPGLQFNVYSTITVPQIRLKGKWLHELGFAPNSRVKVITTKKKLVIELE